MVGEDSCAVLIYISKSGYFCYESFDVLFWFLCNWRYTSNTNKPTLAVKKDQNLLLGMQNPDFETLVHVLFCQIDDDIFTIRIGLCTTRMSPIYSEIYQRNFRSDFV